MPIKNSAGFCHDLCVLIPGATLFRKPPRLMRTSILQKVTSAYSCRSLIQAANVSILNVISKPIVGDNVNTQASG